MTYFHEEVVQELFTAVPPAFPLVLSYFIIYTADPDLNQDPVLLHCCLYKPGPRITVYPIKSYSDFPELIEN